MRHPLLDGHGQLISVLLGCYFFALFLFLRGRLFFLLPKKLLLLSLDQVLSPDLVCILFLGLNPLINRCLISWDSFPRFRLLYRNLIMFENAWDLSHRELIIHLAVKISIEISLGLVCLPSSFGSRWNCALLAVVLLGSLRAVLHHTWLHIKDFHREDLVLRCWGLLHV